MSSFDYLSPLTHTTIYLHSHHFRNARRFVPYSAPIRVLRDTNFLKDFGKFDLWRGLKLNSKVGGGGGSAATGGQESDSGEKSGESKGVEVEVEVEPGSSGSGSNRRKEKQGKDDWWWLGSKNGKWKWQPVLKAQEVAVLLLQLGIVVVVMRFLRPGIQLPGSETRASTAFVSVPYSDFLSKINSDQVLKVEVDGVHIMFKLKSELEGGEVASSGSGSILQQEAEALVKSVAPTKRIVYTTTRPSDIRTPYEKMLENEVEFGSPDRRSGGLFHPALVSNLLLLEYIRI
jgi:cell division protease FtsH